MPLNALSSSPRNGHIHSLGHRNAKYSPHRSRHNSASGSESDGRSFGSRITTDHTPRHIVTAGDVTSKSARQVAQQAAHAGFQTERKLTTAQRLQAEFDQTYQYTSSTPGHVSDHSGSYGSSPSGLLPRLSSHDHTSRGYASNEDNGMISERNSGRMVQSTFKPTQIQAKAEAKVKKYSKSIKDSKRKTSSKKKRHGFPFCCCSRRESKKVEEKALNKK